MNSRVTKREKEKQTKRDLLYSDLLPKRLKWPRLDLPNASSSELHLGLLHGYSGQVFGPSSVAFIGTLEGSWIRRET